MRPRSERISNDRVMRTRRHETCFIAPFHFVSDGRREIVTSRPQQSLRTSIMSPATPPQSGPRRPRSPMFCAGQRGYSDPTGPVTERHVQAEVSPSEDSNLSLLVPYNTVYQHCIN